MARKQEELDLWGAGESQKSFIQESDKVTTHSIHISPGCQTPLWVLGTWTGQTWSLALNSLSDEQALGMPIASRRRYSCDRDRHLGGSCEPGAGRSRQASWRGGH